MQGLTAHSHLDLGLEAPLRQPLTWFEFSVGDLRTELFAKGANMATRFAELTMTNKVFVLEPRCDKDQMVAPRVGSGQGL